MLRRILAAGGEHVEHLRDAAQVHLLDGGDQLPLGHRDARHVVVRRRIVLQVVAGHRLDDRLDLDLARAAAGAGPGRVADRLEGAAAAAQRADDGALRDAVAVADLGVVRQIRGRQRRLRLAHREQQRRARVGQRRAAIEELLQRRRGAGVAEQDGAGELAVADDQLVVDAAARLGVGDDLVVGVAALLLAHDGEVDAHHLELRRGARAFVDLVLDAAGQPIGERRRLLPQRRHQAVDHAAVLGALADGADGRVGGGHAVVDDDAALDLEAGRLRQRDVRADAGGDDQQVALEARAVLELQAGDGAVAEQAGRGLAEVHLHPELFHRLLQQQPGVAIELHLHQVLHQVHHADLEAAARQAARRFEAEQAAADHRGRLHVGGTGQHALAVLERAEHVDAVLVRSGAVRRIGRGQVLERRHERHRAGGDDQRVVGLGPAVGAVDDLRLAIDAGRADAGVQRHVVLGVPVERVDEDVVRLLRAGEHAREQDAVVVAVRLVAEHGDLEAIAAGAREHVFDEAGARHAVADDHETMR